MKELAPHSSEWPEPPTPEETKQLRRKVDGEMAGHPKLLRAKSTLQVRAIFGEARKCGLDEEQLRDVVEDVTKRTRSIAELAYTEAERVIERLKGKSFVPRRTLQYRRQKAGIKQVVQEGQLQLIADLASQRHWSAESLTKFCKRQCGHSKPRTTEDANKIIEALKSMNKREGLWAA